MKRRPHRYSRSAEIVSNDLASRLTLPKPQYTEKREPIDMSALPLAKSRPDRSAAFLDFVRGEICAAYAIDNAHCGGVTEAAHLETGGMSQKCSDYLTVPLCSEHHRGAGSVHQVGLVTFQITHGLNLWQVNAYLQARWNGRKT